MKVTWVPLKEDVYSAAKLGPSGGEGFGWGFQKKDVELQAELRPCTIKQ